MIRILKLSVNADSELTSEDVLSIHLGYYMTHGKVAYSTNIKIAEKPEYVLLTLGNVEDICYLCHVLDYSYKVENIDANFLEYVPDRYKNERKDTWMVFDSMQKIPIEFLDEVLPDGVIEKFIKTRANSKLI